MLACRSSAALKFRVGIHLGDVVEEADGDLMGDAVNIAARLEGICDPGAIRLSEDAYRQGSGPELQLPSLLPSMSEASLYRPPGGLPSEVGNRGKHSARSDGAVPPKKPKDSAR